MRTPRLRARAAGLLPALVVAGAGPAAAFPEEAPALVGDHAGLLAIEKASGSSYAADSGATQSLATQMAFGPGPDPGRTYLYVASDAHPVRRFDYDPDSGALTNRVDALALHAGGIAFHADAQGRPELYLTNTYTSANDPNAPLSRLIRYVDGDGDGVFGGAGDSSAAIVHGVPSDVHWLDQIQIRGDTLFVGSGVRTRNGALQSSTGDAFGESAYGGAILVIDDLTQVPTAANAAGFAAFPSDPTSAQYQDAIDGTTPGAEAPYTSTAPDKLRVHSCGTRNPFGLALDDSGALWFTNNFHRVNNDVYDRSATGSTADPDAWQGPSNDDVHDQMFRAVAGADYGFRNGNWQGNAAAEGAGFFAGIGDPTQLALSVTFDNLDQDGPGGPDLDSLHAAFDQLHDPANPIGLGPHAGVTGLAFNGTAFQPRYHHRAFVARWSGQFPVVDGLDYRDVVLVDPASGAVERVVSGLNAPTDVLADARGNLLVASYYGSIWRITSTRLVPAAPPAAAPAIAALLLAAGLAALGRSARARAPEPPARP